MERELWYLLVKGRLGRGVGALGDFYVFSEHLGTALFKVRNYAGVVGLIDCHLMEAFPLSRSGILSIPEATEQLADDVFLGRGLNTYQIGIEKTGFIYPTGVIRSAADGVLTLGTEEEHFTVQGPDAGGIYTLALVLGEGNLAKVFFLLCDALEEVNMLHISVRDYNKEEGDVEHWVSFELKDKASVLKFIRKYTPDTLENGFVEISLYALTGDTYLTLDEHKNINVTTKCHTFFKALCSSIGCLGIKKVDELVNLELSSAHWHYRPHAALDGASLKELLILNGFQCLRREPA